MAWKEEGLCALMSDLGKYLSETSSVSLSSKAFSLAYKTFTRLSYSTIVLSRSTILVCARLRCLFRSSISSDSGEVAGVFCFVFLFGPGGFSKEDGSWSGVGVGSIDEQERDDPGVEVGNIGSGHGY